MISRYESRFGWGDDIRQTFVENKWGKNPAKKQVAKIMMNSVWGKHAQRPIMPSTVIYDNTTQVTEISDFFSNVYEKAFSFQDCVFLGEDRVMYKYLIDGPETAPDLHKGYLPAACFVPAYGRLQLEAQLHPLGKRALMNDTDSIIYHYIPDEYNIPQGDLLGDWEVEDIDSKNGGIMEFVGLGPKTYAIKCANGTTSVKAKGVSLRYATDNLVNFESMKSFTTEFLANPEEPVRKRIKVPQTSFIWKPIAGMKTYRFLKDLKMEVGQMKGNLSHDGYLYPYGYQEI